MAGDCLVPSIAPAFTSLGDVNRLGDALCKSPNGLVPVSGVQSYRQFRMGCLNTTLGVLERATMPPRCLVSVRLKRMDSIRRKIMRPDGNFTLGQMDDVIGVRVICLTFNEACGLHARLKQQKEFRREKNYIAQEHAMRSGYRAAHTVMQFQQMLSASRSINVRFEIQVRTYYQHQWAV